MKILLLLNKVSQLLPFIAVFTLVSYMAGCSYNSFPVGEWEMDKQVMFNQVIFTYDLKLDHTGTVDIANPILIGNVYKDIHWSFDGTILTVTSDSPITLGGQSVNLHDVLALVDHTDRAITWKDQDGTIVVWTKQIK